MQSRIITESACYLLNIYVREIYSRDVSSILSFLCCCVIFKGCLSIHSFEKECLHGIYTKTLTKSLLFTKSNNLNYLVPIFSLFGHS